MTQSRTRKIVAIILTVSLLTLGFLVLYIPKAFSAPWTVNASVSGGVGGTVSPDTQQVLVDGGSASIIITPDVGYHIDLITDNDETVAGPYLSPYIILNVNENHDVVVTFSDTWTVSATVTGNGSVDPVTQEIVPGENASIAWSADAHYHLESITDNGILQAGPYTSPYTINNVILDHDVDFVFDLDHFDVDASVAGGVGGIVLPLSQTVDYGGTATCTYTETLGYHLDSVTRDGTPVAGPYSSPMDFTNITAATSLVFTFSDTWTISVGVFGNGSAAPLTQEVADGGDATPIDWAPDAHYHIENITDNGSGMTPPFTSPVTLTNVTEDHDIGIFFDLDTVNITASAGTGGSIDPEGEVAVDYGTDQTFNITADLGHHVEDVLVDGDSVGAVTSYTFFGVTTTHTIEASFDLDSFAITALIPGGHGEAMPALQAIDFGFPALITLSAEAGYHISEIDDNGVLKTITDPKSMNYLIDVVIEAHIVTVTFSADVCTVNASVSGGHGTVDPAAQSLDYGNPASITLTPEAHYHIASITDNETLVDGPYSSPYVISNVQTDHNVVVTYAIDTNTITATAGAHGSITPSGAVAVNYGASRSFSFTPDVGYHIEAVFVDAVDQGSIPSYEFTNVTTAHTINVEFNNDALDVTGSVTGTGGQISPASQSVSYGDSASLVLAAWTGYHVNSLTDNGSPVAIPENDIYQLLNIHADHSVVATFAINTYTVTASVSGGHGTVTPASQGADWGGDVTVTVTPFAGYHVDSITDNGTLQPGPYGASYTVSNVAADHNIVVTFAADTASQTWYLAEGSTGGGMLTYVLVQNPGGAAVEINVKFQTDTGQVQGPVDTIPAQSRRTYLANTWVDSLNVSTSVAAWGDVVVERAMYGRGGAWAHDSIGTTSPATTWYLAEGSTGGGMETYILAQNPGEAPVNVNVKFQTGSGEVQGPAGTLAAHTRQTWRVNDYTQTFDVSTMVTATGAIVCERSMYAPDWGWGTCSIGTPATATTWYMAEGSTRGGMHTYVMIQNPGAGAVNVNVQFQTEGGQVQGPVMTVGAESRVTVHVNDWADSFNVSTMVTGNGAIVCERAMYDNAGTWATCTVAAQAPATTWYLAEGCTVGMDTYVLVQNPGSSAVTVDVKFQTASGQVQGPAGAVPAHSRVTYHANDYVESTNVSTKVTATGGGVVVERSMYGPGWLWATGSIGYAQ